MSKDAQESINGDGFRASFGGTLNFQEFILGTIEETADAFSEVDESDLEATQADFSNDSMEDAFSMPSDADFL